MTELVIRPLADGEQHLFHELTEPVEQRVYAAQRDYDGLCAAGEYRPEWTWVALRDGKVVGRAVFWAGPADTEPLALDWFDFGTDIAVGEALLRKAAPRVEYNIDVAAGAREHTEVDAAVRLRTEAARAAGMKPLVERLIYVWTPEDGVPQRPGRLRFREETRDGVLFDVLRRVHTATLDAHARKDIAGGGLDTAAQSELDFMRWMPSPPEWWRLAYTPAGELVGLTVPGRNYVTPIIGLVGVVPEQRGHGYGYDLLVEATHLLAEQGVTQIKAATDLTNHPMAAAFARAHYPVTQERIDLEWPR